MKRLKLILAWIWLELDEMSFNFTYGNYSRQFGPDAAREHWLLRAWERDIAARRGSP